MNHEQRRSGIDDGQRATPLPWYRTITREQWKVLLAAELGWMLDAMDFVLYLTALTTLQREFGYGLQTAGWLTTIALLASAAGGLVFGVVADRVGRARALSATIVIFSLGSLGTAMAQSVAELFAWRALAGLGLGGEWASGAVLVSETWPPAHRDKALSIMQSGWALGYLLAALITAAVLPALGWRWLFAIGALPALIVFWIRREVPEPAVWLATRQKAVPSENRLRALFGPAIGSRTLLATLLTGTIMFGYWGMFSWLPGFLASSTAGGGAGMSIQQSMAWIIPLQIGAFFGYLSIGFLADAVGRRRTFSFFLLAAAGLVPLYGQLGQRHGLLLALGPLLGFFGHGYFSLLGATLAELFPTALRGTGQGFAYGAGRGLSALAPYTIGLLAQRHGIGGALALTSAFFIAGAGLVLLLPQTPRSLDAR